MFEKFFHSNSCQLHGRPLEEVEVLVRYGLIKFSPEFRSAQAALFPNARTFVLGGCRVGPIKTRRVRFCSACREAEARWHEEHPDFDMAAYVATAVERERRELVDSLGKRVLREKALQPPEQVRKCLWIVYRLNLFEVVAYDPESRQYFYPHGGEGAAEYATAAALVEAIEKKFG